MEVGPCEFTQSGIKPVSFQEIKAWSDVCGLGLVENEPQIIKQMSAEYCGSFAAGRDRDAPAPFIGQEIDPEKQSQRVANIFRGHSRFKRVKRDMTVVE